MITVGIIEDDRSLRRNLETFIELEKDLLITFSCNSMEDFLEKRVTIDEPFIVFIDLGLPGISGLEGITFIRDKWADVHLVVITGNDDDDVILDCIQRGANGYLLKPFKIDELRKNIDIIRSGGALITPDVALKLFRKIHKPQQRFEDNTANLTPRESGVVNELLKGLTYKEIGIALSISATTVNDHLKNVYFKMGVRTKSELIAKVLRK
jgi:DNA-binding NarL/FixJ family response regulator